MKTEHNFSEKDRIIKLKKWITEDFLTPIIEDIPFDHIESANNLLKEIYGDHSDVKTWIQNIVFFNTNIKRSVIGYLKHYDCLEETKFQILDELEVYFEKCFGQYIQNGEKLKKEIASFTEKTTYENSFVPLKSAETEVEFSSLIEGVKDYAIFKLSIDGTIASWNEGARNLKGYTKEEVQGKHFSIFYPEDKKQAKFPEFELEEAKKTGRFEDEGYRVTKSGSLIWANVVITAIYNNHNQVTGFIKITRDLTERKNAEEHIRRSEERLRAMISGVKDYAIFMLNPDGTVATWNEGAKEFKGYSEQEIIGKHFSIFYPKDKRESKFPEYGLEQAIKNGSFEDEGLRVRKDGRTFWANVVITAIYNDDNKLIGFTKVTRDLTEKKLADENLRQSEERFRYLVEGVRDYAIYMLNPDGTVASWNEGAETFKGYTKEEIIGKHFRIFYPEEKKEEGFPEYELEVAMKVGRFEDEGFRIRKDGSRFWANVIITAIYNPQKKLLGFTKITKDLTEKKQGEEILRRSEERYRLLIDAVRDYAIFFVDVEGKINSWNEGARRLKGYAEEEVLGKHISLFYTQDRVDSKFPDFELAQAKLHGRFEDEGYRVRKDGSTFFANVIFTVLYDKDQNHIGYSKITRDLTEKKAFEESLHRLNSELEEKVKLRTEELTTTVKELTKINNDLDNFIYTASHDLKAPVSNIEGLIHELFDEIGEEVNSNHNLGTIRDLINLSIKKFQSTIMELTDIAKIQKDSQGKTEKVNLYQLVEDIKITVGKQIINNSVEIICDFKENFDIHFVRKNLHSIFYNLISNGIKYRSPDRNPIIRISSEVIGEFIAISFTDNGLGLKQEHLTKMFSMFKRFHDHVEGSGVGLYIVKRIMENAGGKIEVYSKEDEGTTFKVFIPGIR